MPPVRQGPVARFRPGNRDYAGHDITGPYPDGFAITLIAYEHLVVQTTVVSKMLEQVGLTVDLQILDLLTYSQKVYSNFLDQPPDESAARFGLQVHSKAALVAVDLVEAGNSVDVASDGSQHIQVLLRLEDARERSELLYAERTLAVARARNDKTCIAAERARRNGGGSASASAETMPSPIS